ncbi:Uncharacterised protein [Streptococcus pneumoniae]|nr:Uncharacterised protein [Streptococcus pneumoniae]
MGEWLTVFDQQGKKVGKKLRDRGRIRTSFL